jgi:hypothetical protein
VRCGDYFTQLDVIKAPPCCRIDQIIPLLLLLFLEVLGFELRASCLVGRSSTIGFTSPNLLGVGYFRDRVSRTICPGLALNLNPLELCLLSS